MKKSEFVWLPHLPIQTATQGWGQIATSVEIYSLLLSRAAYEYFKMIQNDHTHEHSNSPLELTSLFLRLWWDCIKSYNRYGILKTEIIKATASANIIVYERLTVT